MLQSLDLSQFWTSASKVLWCCRTLFKRKDLGVKASMRTKNCSQKWPLTGQYPISFPASTALACSAGPLFCLKISPALVLRINVTPYLVSSIFIRVGFYWCRLTAWLDLGSLCLSLVTALSAPTGLESSFLHFHIGRRCPLLFMVAPVLQRMQVHLFPLLSTPAIYRSDYREEVAWVAKVERKKNSFPKQGELCTCWVKRIDFLVIQKSDIISPSAVIVKAVRT